MKISLDFFTQFAAISAFVHFYSNILHAAIFIWSDRFLIYLDPVMVDDLAADAAFFLAVIDNMLFIASLPAARTGTMVPGMSFEKAGNIHIRIIQQYNFSGERRINS